MPTTSTSFKKGVSGNPGGQSRSQAFTEMRDLARKHCPEAMKFYIETLQDKDETWERRDKAASAIMDRGIGKAVQALVTQDEDGNDMPIEVKAWLGMPS